MIIEDLLGEGSENALSGQYLSNLLDLPLRVIVREVELERRKGVPICATSDKTNPGYYLAADSETMEAYCKRLKHRQRELSKTLYACEKTIDKLPRRAGNLNED